MMIIDDYIVKHIDIVIVVMMKDMAAFVSLSSLNGEIVNYMVRYLSYSTFNDWFWNWQKIEAIFINIIAPAAYSIA